MSLSLKLNNLTCAGGCYVSASISHLCCAGSFLEVVVMVVVVMCCCLRWRLSGRIVVLLMSRTVVTSFLELGLTLWLVSAEARRLGIVLVFAWSLSADATDRWRDVVV